MRRFAAGPDRLEPFERFERWEQFKSFKSFKPYGTSSSAAGEGALGEEIMLGSTFDRVLKNPVLRPIKKVPDARRAQLKDES